MSITKNRIGAPNRVMPFLTGGPDVEENTRTGSQTTRRWRGSYAEMNIQRSSCRVSGAGEISLKNTSDGDYELVAVFPFGEWGTEPLGLPSIHELEVNIGQPSIYQCPVARARLDDTNMGIVAQVVREYQSGSYPTSEQLATNPDMTPVEGAEQYINELTGFYEPAIKFFEAIVLRGLDAFIEYYSVYRRTITTANAQQVQLSYTGASKIWTTAEIIAFEKLRSNVVILNPSSQWHKAPPHVQACANQKTQVVYTYTECFQASAFAYQAYGSAVLLDA